MSAGHHPEQDAVAALLRAAGPRQPPPEASRLRVWRAVEEAWRRDQHRRRRRRAAGWAAAAAAAAVLVLTIMIWPEAPPAPPAPVASVDTVIGLVESRSNETSWSRLSPGVPTELLTGAQVRTDEAGLLGLLLEGGVSLRLASSTVVRLEGEDRVRLLDGTLYVDTGPGGRKGAIEIVTEEGTLQDYGTQFELQRADGALRLRVREGRVVVSRADERLVADAGEQLALAPDAIVLRSRIVPDDPAWRWVEALAPEPRLDNEPVSALLRWVARETGRRYLFTDEAAGRLAETTILHGRPGRVEPLVALDVMLLATDLGYTLRSDGTIEVSVK